jgi:hypothetical protein
MRNIHYKSSKCFFSIQIFKSLPWVQGKFYDFSENSSQKLYIFTVIPQLRGKTLYSGFSSYNIISKVVFLMQQIIICMLTEPKPLFMRKKVNF